MILSFFDAESLLKVSLLHPSVQFGRVSPPESASPSRGRIRQTALSTALLSALDVRVHAAKGFRDRGTAAND